MDSRPGAMGSGPTYQLGAISMRLLAHSDETAGAFALGEFTGGAGAWTIPHVHLEHDESFYVLDGEFTFSAGDRVIVAGPGTFLRIGRDQPHVIHAGPDGGRLLVLWVPGGLERMFVELSRLPAGSLQDPATRRSLSERFDSKPV